MAEFEFTSEDVKRVGAKLDSLTDELDERERSMLLSVFQLAGDRLRQTAEREQRDAGPDEPQTVLKVTSEAAELPPLAEGFRNSFNPSVASEVQAADEVSVVATVGVMF